jgi:hypothetical protein
MSTKIRIKAFVFKEVGSEKAGLAANTKGGEIRPERKDNRTPARQKPIRKGRSQEPAFSGRKKQELLTSPGWSDRTSKSVLLLQNRQIVDADLVKQNTESQEGKGHSEFAYRGEIVPLRSHIHPDNEDIEAVEHHRNDYRE